MYLDNKDEVEISRQADTEMTQDPVSHHVDLLGDLAAEPISNNFSEPKMLKELCEKMTVQRELPKPDSSHVPEPDCSISPRKDFCSLTMQER